MLRSPHFSHAALPKALDEAVASQLSRFGHSLTQCVDDARADVRHDRDEEIREHDPEEEGVSRRTVRGSPRQHHESDHDWNGGDRGQRRQRGLDRTRRNHDGEKQRPWSDPRQSDPTAYVETRGLEVLRQRDAIAADDLEHQPDVHHRRQRHTRAHGERTDSESNRDRDQPRHPVLRDRPERRAPLGIDQVGEKPRHEEREGVEQSQDAKPAGGLTEQFRCERTRGAIAGRRGTRPAAGLQEGDTWRHEAVTWLELTAIHELVCSGRPLFACEGADVVRNRGCSQRGRRGCSSPEGIRRVPRAAPLISRFFGLTAIPRIRLDYLARGAPRRPLYQPIDDAGVESRWGKSQVGQRAGRAEVENRQIAELSRSAFDDTASADNLRWLAQPKLTRMMRARAKVGAGGGNRTHTPGNRREILSLVRLPVSPLRPGTLSITTLRGILPRNPVPRDASGPHDQHRRIRRLRRRPHL